MSKYTLHGVTIEDPFYWLEDIDSPQTRQWVAQQNQRTDAFLSTIPERESIRRRLTELWNYEKCSVPIKQGGRYFFTKNDGLQNQSVLCVRDTIESSSRVILDPNLLSADGTVALTATVPSRDGKYLAYGLARAGSDWEEWHVLDVGTGKATSDYLKWIKFSIFCWTADNQGLFYCRYDEPGIDEAFQGVNYFQKLCYHKLGTPQSEDEIVYFRADQKEWLYEAVVTDDGRFLVIHVCEATGIHNAVFYRDLQSDSGIVELIPDFEARYQFIGNDGNVFWFLTNNEAPRGRIIAVVADHPERSAWRPIVPEREHTLETASVVGNAFVARYLRDAQACVEIIDVTGRPVRTLQLPGIGSVTGFYGRRDDPETFFDFTSFSTPTTVYRYNVATGEMSTFHRPELGFDPEDYVTNQVFFPSKDGTRVPMFITRRRGLALDGSRPTELYGYGGFNISMTPLFSVTRLVWMEMGGVYAVPNLRGGGEYGEQWHEAGTKSRKQNVFDDFISAAEWLIQRGYTSSRHLSISGRSNGGLLVGACITQRPELFGAAVAHVGVMDMLKFHRFTIGWSWVSDYGSPENFDDFKALYAYSPYHNVRPGMTYPSVLITTADHDDRVVPAHSYKFAAALQAAQSGEAPVLIRIDVQAGHGVGKPTSKLIAEATDVLSFLIVSI